MASADFPVLSSNSIQAGLITSSQRSFANSRSSSVSGAPRLISQLRVGTQTLVKLTFAMMWSLLLADFTTEVCVHCTSISRSYNCHTTIRRHRHPASSSTSLYLPLSISPWIRVRLHQINCLHHIQGRCLLSPNLKPLRLSPDL